MDLFHIGCEEEVSCKGERSDAIAISDPPSGSSSGICRPGGCYPYLETIMQGFLAHQQSIQSGFSNS